MGDGENANHEAVFKMAGDIGEIKGQLSSFIETQKTFNKAIVEKVIPRIDSLEESRTKAKAYTMAGATIAGVIGGGMPALWQKLQGMIGWS